MNNNIDPAEVKKFEQLAHRWWDPTGPFKPLHQLNPIRLDFIQQQVKLTGLKVLDVGCGGGILSEALAAAGAEVTGIDAAAQVIQIAKQHAGLSGLAIDYRCVAIETFAAAHAQQFDVISCMELLEHVPDPAQVVACCQRMLKPGGHAFFSTINRTPMAFVKAIIGAEYILNLLPRGTHTYEKFIKPSELAAWARDAGLDTTTIKGISYNPLTQHFHLSSDTLTNYIVGTFFSSYPAIPDKIGLGVKAAIGAIRDGGLSGGSSA